MEMVLRATAVYVMVWVLFRLAGNRTFSDMTTFDFVLLLIVSECLQQALTGDDFSITAAAVVATTLVALDIAFSLVKQAFPKVEKVIDGMPMVIVEHGRPLKDRMRRARVDEDDILNEARLLQGLERMDQIKYAVLERNGGISVIPYTTSNR
jgi:uncharacterized membrane protein YcaP (DUF421 family)